MVYKASLDPLAKIITLAVIILFAAIIINSAKTRMDINGDITALLFHSVIIVFLIAVITGAYLFSVQKYILNKNELIINRPLNPRTINISDIQEARLLATADMRGAIRLFGVGGLFGYFGKYHSKGLGTITLYTTQRKNRIFIRTYNGEKLVISPDDIGLLDELLSKLPVRYVII